MKRTGSNNSDQNVDLNTADNDIQSSQLAAANHGDSVTAPNGSGKVSVLNRRTLGVASVLGLLFASLLAGTLFFTTADESASSAPNFADKTVSEKTTFTFPKSQPAEFSPASSFNRSVLDPADISSSPKARGSFTASRNQGVAETTVAQPSSANSARSQCSGGDCVSPRRAPVTEVTVKLFKLGVEKLFSTKDPLCSSKKLCSAGDGVLVAGAKFALYEGATVDEAKKVGEYTVGEDGVELSGLQPGKTYTLKELTAPDGYEPYPKAVKFTVGKDRRAKYQYSKFTSYFENNEFYFPNLKLPEPEVWLFKLGVEKLAVCDWGSCSAGDGELLEGARFALYEGTVLDQAHKVGENFTVGADGLKIPGLQVGKTYSLVEVTSPAGYQVNRNDLTFEVDVDGKAKYQTDAGSQFFVDNKIFVPNQKAAPPAVKFKLFKLGVEKLFSTKDPLCSSKKLCSAGDGVLVAGAKFALYEGATVDEAKKVGEYTVGEDGVELSGLQPGKTYTLKELTAPDGYEPYPKAVKFTVGKDRRAKYQYSKFTSYFENNEFYFPNLKLPEPEVWLFKLGVEKLAVCDWGSCSAGDGELLEGARFALYEGTVLDQAHKVGENFTVGADGLKIPGLQVGKTYSLVEVTSPAGYQVNRNDLTFEVDVDGKAKYQTDAGSQFFVDNKIFVPNQKAAPPAVKFKLFKLGVTDSTLVRSCTVASKMCSAGDGELVAGAKFVLYKGQKVDEAKKVGEYIVGKDGLEISDLQVNEYYTLKEVEAPAGYEVNPNAAGLRVKSDGVVGRRVSKVYRDLVNNEFYFPNLKEPIQTIDIALNKVSDKGTALENVKFDLYEADNLDKPVQNITTGKDGKANLTVTPGGKYRLVETETVSGYALLPQAIEFQVAANGTVTIDKQNGNVNTVTSGDKTLKVVNYPEGKLPLSGQSGFLVVLLSGLSLLLVGVAISLLGRKRQ